MSSADRREPDALERETLLAYEAPPAPGDMADRVLAGLRAAPDRGAEEDAVERPPMRRAQGSARRWIAVAAVAVVVAAAALLLRTAPGDLASTGHRVAGARESIAIGGRAVAVAEAGSELAWNVLSDGAASVDQRSGDAFYRVTPGKAFVVSVPGASIRVLGTCFRVEVSDMTSRKKLVAAGAAGAVLSAAVLVTVYEGRVLLENAHGEVELAPGEQGSASPGAQPARSEAAVRPGGLALQRRIRDLEQSLQRAEKKLAEAAGPVEPGQTPRYPDQQFAAEPRDPSWAPAQEGRIEERLTRYLELEADSARVECRSTCCEIALDKEAWEQVMGDGDRKPSDLTSDAGLGHFAASDRWSLATDVGGREDGLVRSIMCLDPSDLQPRAGQADRGAEREALVTAAHPSAQACMRGAKTPLDIVTMLRIDKAGEIVDVLSLVDPLGHGASACVERAVLAAARFAPSVKDTRIMVELELQPVP